MKHSSTTATPKRRNITGCSETCTTIPLSVFDDPNQVMFGKWLACHANGDHFVRLGSYLVKGNEELSDGDRAMLVRWLSTLPNPSERILREIAAAAIEIRSRHVSVVAPIRKGEIGLELAVKLEAPNNKAFLGYMMATLLSAGHGENFARCPECEKWFFDIPHGRPMRKFCSPNHGNAYRQRKLRNKRR